MDEKIKKMEEFYKKIREDRLEIAKNKALISTSKPQHWEDATGIAKEKEDYVKSKVADLNKEIDISEADIEFSYNMINVLLYQMEISDE